jgi:hypothetical protein
MIITKTAKVKVNEKNISHLTYNGYDVSLRDIIEIDIEHLSIGSHFKIEVKCDVCGKERGNLRYKDYLINIKNGGYYSCKGRCSESKIKSTSILRYGTDRYSKTDEFKEKVKNTTIDKYGTDYYFKTDEFKERFKMTCIEKYGVDNPSRVVEFKNKRKNTMIENHGVEYYVLSFDFKEKSEKTSLENYGFKHPLMNKDQQRKMLNSQGLDFETDEYRIFASKVYSLTAKNKKLLIENWNGYDFYDNEYIKDNFNLNPLSSEYPTIDHKISIKSGYLSGKSVDELSNIDNLCFTKRSINSKKSSKNYDYFMGQYVAE